jgi:hypothetical protein
MKNVILFLLLFVSVNSFSQIPPPSTQMQLDSIKAKRAVLLKHANRYSTPNIVEDCLMWLDYNIYKCETSLSYDIVLTPEKSTIVNGEEIRVRDTVVVYLVRNLSFKDFEDWKVNKVIELLEKQ